METPVFKSLFKFQRGKLGTALLLVTALFFLIPALALAQNNPPVVNAGPDQTIYLGDSITLHGTATDPNGDPIVYWQWEVLSAPGRSTYSLQNADGADATFTANTTGNYVLTLIASDGLLWSDPAAESNSRYLSFARGRLSASDCLL